MTKLPLYAHTAPYTEFSPDQPQPSLAAFPVPGSRGAVVVCPGGGYAYKAEHEGNPIAEALNSMGISAYVLDYRVAPCHREAPLSDAKRAVRLVRSLGYARVAILGFSAGGNLCCAAATLYEAGDPAAEDPVERITSRPDAFLSCYAVVSLGKYTHQGSRENLLGADWEDAALRRRFSAEENVTEDTPPAFIWHTSEDGSVPVQNSLLLAKALADCRVRFEMHIYPDGHHGLGMASSVPVASAWLREAGRWLLEKGYGR